MPKTLQLRRGTTAEITANTPASGELFVDTEKKTVTVGDGSTAGGIILARNDRVSDVYNVANAVNGMATGAYNAANNKQDLLVSGTNIKSINGSSILGAGNLVVSGGGGGSANTVAVTPTSDNFITLGTPIAVEYLPASNIAFSGPLVVDANGLTSSFQSSSNAYIDVVSYNYASTLAGGIFDGRVNQLMALIFNRRTEASLPRRWVRELESLEPGDKLTLKFIAGANNAVMDTFTVPFTVAAAPSVVGGQAATDWARFNMANFGLSSTYAPNYPVDKPNNGGTGYSISFGADPKTTHGKTIFLKNEVVQQAYTSNTTLITTQLVGEITGRPINHNFLTNVSGKGYLNPTLIFSNETNSNARNVVGGTFNQLVGCYQILIEKPAGTVVTLSPSDYNEILISNTSVAVANTVSSIKERARVYDAANSKVWISSANLMPIVTTTTPLQIYNPPTQSALIDVGPTLKMYGDTVNNRLVSTGKLSKAEGYKNLGVVASQSTTANVIIFPTVVSTKYLDSANTGAYTPVRSTNGVLLDNISSSGTAPVKLMNLTQEIYDLVGANNSMFYVQYSTVGTGGQSANLVCRTINQGNTGFYVNSASGNGSGWTEGYWVYSNIMNFWQSGTFYAANTSGWSRPTWQYEIENKNQKLVIPGNVVTLTTSADVINELVTINKFVSGPNIVPSSGGSANNLLQIYVDGIPTTVNGIDVANNRIITNLSQVKYGNTNFTGSVISVADSLVDYATIQDVQSQIPSWIAKVSSSSSTTSTSYYIGGGASGIDFQQFNINNIAGATSPREINYSFGFPSTQGAANFGQGADRNINYDAQSTGFGADRLYGDNASLQTFSLGVVGGINSNYMYANNIMGTSGTSYANTHTANTIYSSSMIRIGARNVSNPDSANNLVAVLFRANTAILQNDSPNVTAANTTLPITTGTVASNQQVVPPGAPLEARSFRLGGNPFAGGSGGGGFYIANQNWDLSNTAISWTFESWVCCSSLYSQIYLLTALNTGNDLTSPGTTYIRGEFPFFGTVRMNDNSALNVPTYNATPYAIGRNSSMSGSTQLSSGYNNYFPLTHKWYHLAFVYDATAPAFENLTMYINGFTAGRQMNPNFGASSLLYNWGVYASDPTWYYNFRVTFGASSAAVRYQPPPGWDGSSGVKAFTPELNPYGVTPERTITSDTQYRYDALDLTGGIRMDNTANTYMPGSTFQPPTNPIGGYLFVENGALKYKGSSGTVTTIANP